MEYVMLVDLPNLFSISPILSSHMEQMLPLLDRVEGGKCILQ